MPSWPLGGNQKKDQQLSLICDDDHGIYDMHYNGDDYYYFDNDDYDRNDYHHYVEDEVHGAVIRRRITNSALFATNSLPVDRGAILMNSDQLN